MAKRVATILPILLALGCGGDDESPVEKQDVRTAVKNACGGERALAFLDRPASPGDACGGCAAGVLVCATPEVLVCIGSTDASCVDGGMTNLCGGRGPLRLDGIPATPGQPCGPCRGGTTICAAPEIVACVGASGGTCRDAGGDAAIVDTTIVDTAIVDAAIVDASTLDSVRDSASSDVVDADSAPMNACGGYGPLRYQGMDALPGGRCGPCRDGTLVCDSPNTLACSGQSTLDVCDTDATASNACGGIGPLTWRGALADRNARCGPCNGYLRCASPTTLVCGGALDCPEAGPTDNCDIPTSAYTLRGPTLPAPPAETAPATTSVTTITLSANWLVYNPFDFRLYASVASLQGTGGNSIAVIDPYAGTIVKSIYVGIQPRSMALSDDGQALWVALDGEGTVRQVNLVSGTAGQQFAMGQDGFSRAWFAESLAVLPGSHGSLVVTRYQKSTSATDGPVVYDDGVARPYSGGPLLGSSPGLLIPTYSPALLFGYNNHSSGYDFSAACVNANGLFVKQVTRPFSGFGATFAFDENVIYAGSGIAYDIATGSTIGTFAGSGSVASEAAKRRVYFASVPFQATMPNVSAYDMGTFLLQGSETVPISVSSGSSVQNFARWGRYGYAFRLNSQLIVIGRSALVAAAP